SSAPLQFEAIGSNVVAGMRDRQADDVLAGAVSVVRARLQNQRVAVVPMEGGGSDDFAMTIHVSTQMPHMFARTSSKTVGFENGEVRVITPHVGGGFGAKAGMSAEHAAVIPGARKLGRPLSWIHTRSENLVSMPHGRGQVQWIEMVFDAEARLTGMRCRVLADAEAYAG